MANKIKRNLIQFGSGFLGGFGSGGFWGGVTGGTAAAAAGGKAKPLKSIAIGAGVGVVGGSIAQRLGWQGQTSRIGKYEFRPLSSRLFGKPITTVADKAAEVARPSGGSSPTGEPEYQYGGGGFDTYNTSGGASPTGEPEYQYGGGNTTGGNTTGGALVGGGSSNILPLLLIGGAFLFLRAA